VRWQLARNNLPNLGCTSQWCSLGTNTLATETPTTGPVSPVGRLVMHVTIRVLDPVVDRPTSPIVVRVKIVVRVPGMLGVVVLVVDNTTTGALGHLVTGLAAGSIDVDTIGMGATIVVLAVGMMPSMADNAALGTLNDATALALGTVVPLLGVLALTVDAPALLLLLSLLGRVLRPARIPLRLGGKATGHPVLGPMT
jgi:hypothetical protein